MQFVWLGCICALYADIGIHPSVRNPALLLLPFFLLPSPLLLIWTLHPQLRFFLFACVPSGLVMGKKGSRQAIMSPLLFHQECLLFMCKGWSEPFPITKRQNSLFVTGLLFWPTAKCEGLNFFIFFILFTLFSYFWRVPWTLSLSGSLQSTRGHSVTVARIKWHCEFLFTMNTNTSLGYVLSPRALANTRNEENEVVYCVVDGCITGLNKGARKKDGIRGRDEVLVLVVWVALCC